MTTPTDQMIAQLTRGVEATYSVEDLKKKLATGSQLRIKLGMDPTAPDIHLGHAVVLRKLRQFQDLGHKAVLIIGDYTARIGDPTGRDTTRPVLNEADIEANAKTYLEQAGLILDLAEDRFELRFNSQWLKKLSFADTLSLTGYFTVQQMLHRENFKNRMDAGKEIVVTEFMYPIMQAYDSVVVQADVELGGTDQTFNNLRGRDLMGKNGLPPQVVMVLPILVGLDGTEKMSKSKNNYVGLTDNPNDMFGKLMSIPDQLMDNYFTLLTALPRTEIDALLDQEKTHPRDAKETLAKNIVAQFHDGNAAEAAAAEFRSRFAEGALPSDLETKAVAGSDWPLANLIAEVGFAASNGEARRLIKQGAVTWGEEKPDDPAAHVTVTSGPTLLKVGKRRVCQVQLA